MGNALNMIGKRSTLQHCHTEHMHLPRTWNYQFELWSILIYRAISEYICRILIYEKGITNDKLRVLNIISCTTVPEYVSNKAIYRKTIAGSQFLWWSMKMFKALPDCIHKPICDKGKVCDRFQLWIIFLWRAISGYIYHKPIYKKGESIDQFVNLPEDVQRIILSKLPLKEVARTSVLSTNWRCLWTVCPKLCFDGTAMFSKNANCKQKDECARQFIDTVNAVLQQFHGKVVEALDIKFDFDTLLVNHLNNWVRLSASLHTKFLSLDLTPRGLEALDDPQYVIPFQHFDKTSCLQHILLHFVSIKLPAQFCGFPKLKKLDLRNVKVTAKDLQDMLSNCCTLEWLSIVLCEMDGELKVHCPLPSLLYLNVSFCDLTSIQFHAVKLKTVIYEGSPVPINLGEVTELKNAKIRFYGATIGDAIPAFSNVLTYVQNLTFRTLCHRPKVPCLLENACKFSHLKHLQLLLSYKLDVDNLTLVPFLGCAPLLEKLEIHFSSIFGFFYMEGAHIRRFECQHKYLKDVCITGFKASNGQVEFIVNIVENTPSLEILTVDQLDKRMKNDPMLVKEKVGKYMDAAVYEFVRSYIKGTVSRQCHLTLLF